METIKKLSVFLHNELVGTMALFRNMQVAFQYDKEWLSNGFSISPYSLPLEKKVFIPKFDPFDGLFGVFADSLHDGWGRLLLDRLLIKNKMNPFEVHNINRLAIVGSSGMGALTYQPVTRLKCRSSVHLDFDQIAKECSNILKSDYSDNLDELYQLGGSSGGARPKILIPIDGEEWIIKFPSSLDQKDVGEREYHYSLCAKECGITMEKTRLFPSKICSGYFGTRRFDRKKTATGENSRIHMISVSALLETSHRIPNLDYNILMRLTLDLTKDFSEVEKLFRIMCFNVFSHNRDDHSRNFSFLYDTNNGKWILSPTYDLTYSNSIGGEHATCINGNGKNPGMKDILEVARTIGIKEGKAKTIATEIEEKVRNFL
jgi:serine/threonine-protein kinase HipA